MFRELCVIFGIPDIDLFASRLNKRIKQFYSWKPDPETEHFDAFTINWAQFEVTYMFPLFPLISTCLQKMRAEEARGWLVARSRDLGKQSSYYNTSLYQPHLHFASHITQTASRGTHQPFR
ncbi:hypothetical protein Pmani_026230 [Petrolisthes manimaculis]|uniref:Uncharacterized protein n=1 Tax=Petrolisthes manimaculis TaxID=1843537 RepID=A0AAE1TY14_9EUCA|nr:hypothetical protein Pmani_026230 [Petrolisthes manimaculis]